MTAYELTTNPELKTLIKAEMNKKKTAAAAAIAATEAGVYYCEMYHMTIVTHFCFLNQRQ